MYAEDLETTVDRARRAGGIIEDGIRSGRARQIVTDMRTLLSPYRRRKIPLVTDLDARAARYLAHTR